MGAILESLNFFGNIMPIAYPAPDQNSIIDLDDWISHEDSIYRSVHMHLIEKIRRDVNESLAKVGAISGAIRRNVRAPSMSLQPIDQGVVFFIDGTRGAGKSTFLRAVCQNLCDDLKPKSYLADRTHNARLGFLSLIDPSRIEMPEVLLLAVVKRLQRKVEEHGQCICDASSQHRPLNDFRRSLEKLAEGLDILRPDHAPLKHVDPEVFLQVGLERIGHGDDLRNRVHEMIEVACRVLGVDALVLAFDDADVHAGKCIELMEVLRKYLNSPRLVTLVAGDMELYSLLARKHFIQSSCMGKDSNDETRNEQRAVMLSHLEAQYLQKLFPAQRRSRLVSMQALGDDQRDVYVKSEYWGGRDLRVANVVDHMIGLGWFLLSRGEVDLYRRFIMNLPIRSIVQLLRACVPYIDVNPDPKVWPLFVASEKDPVATLRSFNTVLVESVRSISAVGLFDHDVKVDAIVAGDMSALIWSVFHLVVKESQYDTGAYLRPRFHDDGMNACCLMLSAEFARMCLGRPDRFLRYWMQAVGGIAVYGANKDEFGSSPDNFARSVGLRSGEDCLHWAWCTAPFLGQKVSMPKTDKGEVKNIVGNERINKSFSIGGNRPAMVARLSLVYVQRAGVNRRLYCSGFVLLGLIERLLGADHQSLGNVTEYDVRQVLERAWRIPTISENYGKKEDDEKPQSYVRTSLRSEGFSEAFSDLVNELHKWLCADDFVRLRQSFAPSAVYAGKVWTRLYFNLEQNSGRNAVDHVRDFVLCFLKALYIEGFSPHEAGSVVAGRNADRTYVDVINFDFHNVMGWSYEKFFKTYSMHERKRKNNFPLLDVLWSCPLIKWLFEDDGLSGPTTRGLPNEVRFANQKSGASGAAE